jgi:short subunit dehydrogenase
VQKPQCRALRSWNAFWMSAMAPLRQTLHGLEFVAIRLHAVHQAGMHGITGGGTGPGAETARHLASKGAAVAIGARRRNKLDEVVAQIAGAGGRARAYLLDVADKKQFKGRRRCSRRGLRAASTS